MLRFSTTKIVATIGAILIGLMLAVPSFFSPEQRQAFAKSAPSWVPAWIVPTRAIVLGLDLQGGSHILLEVDQNDLVRTQILALRDDVRRGDTVVTTGGIVGKVTKVTDDPEIEVEIADGVRVKLVRGMISEVRTRGEPVKS